MTEEERYFYEEIHKIVKYEYRKGIKAGTALGIIAGAVITILIQIAW